MARPMIFAAVDAGSNALRLLIAEARSSTSVRKIHGERFFLRLGHSVFSRGRLDGKTIREAVEAFRRFRRQFNAFGAERYLAYATSAAREAENRAELLDAVWRRAGVELEIIKGVEEARLVRSAVLGKLGGRMTPSAIMDLGGGSLEISLFREKRLALSATLPLGAVRLMERFDAAGALGKKKGEQLRAYVADTLDGCLSRSPIAAERHPAPAALCGGNAEALGRLFPGPRTLGMDTLDPYALCEALPRILSMNVRQRTRAYHVNRDRAQVMGVAAVVIAALARRMALGPILIPRVGVREGIILELTEAHFGRPPARPRAGAFPFLHGKNGGKNK